jgi:hypothetical protein
MLEIIKKNLINIPGKNIEKKIIVFESDDWGSIRIPNKNVYEALIANKLVSDKDPFSKYDCIENDEDLNYLLNVLVKFKDINNNNPIITTNTVVCNPDFNKIKAHNYTQFFAESFKETLAKRADSENAFGIITKAIEEKLFYPQFHAKEHLNVSLWMNLLQNENKEFIKAFDLNCFSIQYNSVLNRRDNIMATYDYNSEDEFIKIAESITQGLNIFEEIFNFKSQTTIAPCYVWDKKIEKVFLKNNVYCFQGSRFQNSPIQNTNKFKKQFHYNGDINADKQVYLSRNGLFEPSLNPKIDWVDKCLESINTAFRWKKPAVIGTHRLNFIGSIDSNNRDRNLKLLEELLKKIITKWPDVEFINSSQLFSLLKK